MVEKFQWYNGIKFTRDDETGYYLNSTLRVRMHVYVWVCNNGDIPKGYEVHHKDRNRANNDISNLELLTKSEHMKMHYDESSDERKEFIRNNMEEKARPAAIKWHKSKEGREWHSQHAKMMIQNGDWFKKAVFTCEQCGKEFEMVSRKGKHKFCSGACEQMYRRHNHLNDIEVECVICGSKFIADKYGPSKTCSGRCAGKLRWQHIREKKGN